MFATSNSPANAPAGTPEELWFVARDVLDVLGLGDTTTALANTCLTSVCDFKLPGQRGRANKLVNEAGLYRLILRSDKAQHPRMRASCGKEAEPFQTWVTEVVLPTIRRDGSYVRGEGRWASEG